MSPSTDNPFVIIMLIVIIILGIAITLLANVLLGAAQFRADQQKAEEKQPDQPGTPPTASGGDDTGPAPTISGIGAAGALAMPAVNGLSDTAFYMIVGVVFLEVFVLMALLYNLRVAINVRKKREAALEAASAVPAVPRLSWWDRLNRFKPVEQEADLLLDHDYDGIRELDNKLPPLVALRILLYDHLCLCLSLALPCVTFGTIACRRICYRRSRSRDQQGGIPKEGRQ